MGRPYATCPGAYASTALAAERKTTARPGALGTEVQCPDCRRWFRGLRQRSAWMVPPHKRIMEGK